MQRASEKFRKLNTRTKSSDNKIRTLTHPEATISSTVSSQTLATSKASMP